MKAVAIAAACCVLLATAWGGVAAADVGTPGAPTGLAATATASGIRLRWDESPEPHVWEYDVYRKTGSGSWSTAPIIETWRSDAVDTTAVTGLTYSYVVVAVSVTDAESPDSGVATETAGTDAARPRTPENLTVAPKNGAIAIKWDPITDDASLIGYGILRKVGGDDWRWFDSFSTDYDRVLDTGLTNGVAVQYRIQAQDAVGWGASSAAETATPVADTTAPATPTGLTGHRGDGEVRWTWSRNSEADVARYELQGRRCNVVGWIDWGSSDGPRRFLAKWLVNDAEYCFRIRAVDDSGNASAWSSESRATPDRATIRLGVDGGYPWDSAAALDAYEALDSPSARVEVYAASDPADAQLETDLEQLTDIGVRPLILAGYGSSYPANTRGEVGRFCGGIASKYGPGGSAGLSDDVAVRYIEFGNESSYSHYPATQGNPAGYARLLEECVDAATAANPFVGVLAIGDDPAWVGWIPAIAAELGADWEERLSGLTTHPYGPPFGEPGSSWFYRIESIMDRDTRTFTGKLPIFATEFGVASSTRGVTFDPDNYGWSTTMNPAGARDAFEHVLEALWDDYPRVTQLYWFKATDNVRDDGVNRRRESFFGLFDVGGAPKGTTIPPTPPATRPAIQSLPDFFTGVNDDGGFH